MSIGSIQSIGPSHSPSAAAVAANVPKQQECQQGGWTDGCSTCENGRRGALTATDGKTRRPAISDHRRRDDGVRTALTLTPGLVKTSVATDRLGSAVQTVESGICATWPGWPLNDGAYTWLTWEQGLTSHQTQRPTTCGKQRRQR
jgi:hypothetical protein